MTLKDISYNSLCISFLVICSWISIPTIVPFTLQTLAIFTIVSIRKGKQSFFIILTYLLMGAIGLPVFSQMSGGMSTLFGLTGGYIFGFLFSILFLWWVEKIWHNNYQMFFLLSLIALCICYLLGSIWFYFVYTSNASISIYNVLATCVIPFIIPDLIKIIISTIIFKRIHQS